MVADTQTPPPAAAVTAPELTEAMVRAGLTRTQARVYHLLFTETARNGYQPNYDELARLCGFAGKTGVCTHLCALQRKGWIAMRGHNGGGRAIRFLRNPDGTPFRGFIPTDHATEEPS